MDKGQIISADFSTGQGETVVAEIIDGKVANVYTYAEWDAIAACIQQIKTSNLLDCSPQRTHKNA